MFIAHWSISLNSHSNPKAGNIISILTDEGTGNVLENLRFPQSAAFGAETQSEFKPGTLHVASQSPASESG